VAIVGDIALQRALHLAAKYLGSLSKRPRHDRTLEPLRQLGNISGPLSKTIDVETITPRAYTMLMWRSAAWQEVRGRRLIHLISRILEGRLREEVREKRGLTYAASVFAQPNKIYPNLSALYVAFTADPNNIAEAVRVARSVVEKFAAEGPTDEELNTVRKQLKNSIDTMLERPRFWVSLLSDLEYHGTRLEDVEGLLDQILAFSRADIAAEAKKVITPERFILVVGNPVAPIRTPLVQAPEPAIVTR
jgi:predicted Zn-dependent peptidase